MELNKRYSSGVIVAASCRIKKCPKTTTATLWKVESQSDSKKVYNVIMEKDGNVTCDCPDFLNRFETCKHIYGVIFYETQ